VASAARWHDCLPLDRRRARYPRFLRGAAETRRHDRSGRLLRHAFAFPARLKNSEAAWNRGDLAAFASDYEDAPTTTFVGREVTRGGVDAILARYQRGYSTAEARGALTFSRTWIQAAVDQRAKTGSPLEFVGGRIFLIL
jgi:hypothetical protein